MILCKGFAAKILLFSSPAIWHGNPFWFPGVCLFIASRCHVHFHGDPVGLMISHDGGHSEYTCGLVEEMFSGYGLLGTSYITQSRGRHTQSRTRPSHRPVSNIGALSGLVLTFHGLPCGSVVKILTTNAGDVGLIPGSVRSEEGKGNLPQYSCLGNPMDRGASWATVCGVTKSQTRLSD